MTASGDERDGISALLARRVAPGPPEEAERYSAMVGDLRTFLERLASARLGSPEVELLGRDLQEWSRRLAPLEAGAGELQFGTWTGSPNRGQAMVPDIALTQESDDTCVAQVRFSSFFHGENGAAHGGAIPLMFDDLVGHLGFRAGRPPSRTAYLTTDFRSITPIGDWLTARVWLERTDGRKRFYRGTLHHGDVLCAEADALLVALRPGQP